MSLILPAAFPRHLSITRIRPVRTFGVCVVSDMVAGESIRTVDDWKVYFHRLQVKSNISPARGYCPVFPIGIVDAHKKKPSSIDCWRGHRQYNKKETKGWVNRNRRFPGWCFRTVSRKKPDYSFTKNSPAFLSGPPPYHMSRIHQPGRLFFIFYFSLSSLP